jgi:predicted PhzF superfamily epimerase YddE/YHI9
MNGITFILVDVTDPATLIPKRLATKSIRLDLDAGWNEGLNGILYYVVLPSTKEEPIRLQANLIAAQTKDSAPGSAACALGCFLSIDANQPRTRSRYYITQGANIGRKSEME